MVMVRCLDEYWVFVNACLPKIACCGTWPPEMQDVVRAARNRKAAAGVAAAPRWLVNVPRWFYALLPFLRRRAP